MIFHPRKSYSGLYAIILLAIPLIGLFLQPEATRHYIFFILEILYILVLLRPGLADNNAVVPSIGLLILLNVGLVIGAHSTELKNFFEGHTTTAPLHSAPTNTVPVPSNTNVQSNQVQRPTEIHLPNGQEYILQNGKAYPIQSN